MPDDSEWNSQFSRLLGHVTFSRHFSRIDVGLYQNFLPHGAKAKHGIYKKQGTWNRGNKITECKMRKFKRGKIFTEWKRLNTGSWQHINRNAGKEWTLSLCISQFHLHPANTPPPASRADPKALVRYLPWMVTFRVWGLLSCQFPRGGDEKRGQIPRPPSTLQHFLLITQSNSAILSILMCDFLFELTSSFVIAVGF